MKRWLIRCGEQDMCSAISAPAAGYGKKNLGPVGNEGGLLFGREHEIAVALRHMRQGREDVAADAEIRRAHMRACSDAGQGESDTAEVVSSHADLLRHFDLLKDASPPRLRETVTFLEDKSILPVFRWSPFAVECAERNCGLVSRHVCTVVIGAAR